MGKELIHQWTFKDPVSLPVLAGAVSRTKAWELLPTGLRGWKGTYLTSYTDFQLLTALSCPTGSKVPSAGVENSRSRKGATQPERMEARTRTCRTWHLWGLSARTQGPGKGPKTKLKPNLVFVLVAWFVILFSFFLKNIEVCKEREEREGIWTVNGLLKFCFFVF